MNQILIRITAPWFVAGVVVDSQGNKRAAPIIHYMKNLSICRIFRYSNKRGWKAEILLEKDSPYAQKT